MLDARASWIKPFASCSSGRRAGTRVRAEQRDADRNRPEHDQWGRELAGAALRRGSGGDVRQADHNASPTEPAENDIGSQHCESGDEQEKPASTSNSEKNPVAVS